MFQDRLSASGWDAGRDTSRSPYVVTPRIKKDESQRGAAETDGRTDTYVQETSGGPTPGCRSNAIRNWREGASASVSERERDNSVWPKVFGQHLSTRFCVGLVRKFTFHGLSCTEQIE